MTAAEADGAADAGLRARSAGYRRSAGSPRGEARRRQLLERVVDDVAINGLVDFSLRRAARAPQGRLVEVADSYTLVPLDQPGVLARLIREFSHVPAA